MNSFIVTLAGLSLVYLAVITTVYANEIGGMEVSKDQLIALTRDHFGRSDPDALLNGFFPVWAAIQFSIACFFFVIAVLSLVCYILGCRTPPGERAKQIN